MTNNLMKARLLWFDDDQKKTLVTKILEAANYYLVKYGKIAKVCTVSLVDLAKEQSRTGGGVLVECGEIKVEAKREIRPGHLWIGVE